MTSFADLTTIGVGGPIATFLEPTTRVGVIEAVEEADSQGLPLCVIGGGSNMLVSDMPFEGVVVRDARRSISVLDEAAPVEDDGRVVHVNAEAGCNWDDFVDYCVRLGLEGVEGLSGIPGTVGASVVQNIGAYGQEVATSVDSVEVWDRKERAVKALRNDQLAFGYRSGDSGRGIFPDAAIRGAVCHVRVAAQRYGRGRLRSARQGVGRRRGRSHEHRGHPQRGAEGACG